MTTIFSSPLVDTADHHPLLRESVGTLVGSVIETPGHTLGHIAYHFAKEHLLFAGDTLFSLGCGRVFEGTMEQMWHSLGKLAALPPETRLWCGHELRKPMVVLHSASIPKMLICNHGCKRSMLCACKALSLCLLP